MDDFIPVFVVATLFIGLPWLIFHYVTKWKTSATLTNDDERMLGDMHALANRLEERLETVERLVAQDNPNWQPSQPLLDHEDNEYLEEFRTQKSRTSERNR